MQAILNVAFPIFGVILAGYLAGRWRILGGEATGALNAFVSYFALPVLFFGTLARTPVHAVLDPALMAGFGLVVVATFVVGMISTRLTSGGGLAAMSLQGISSSWGNVGYMGVPLCLAAFGEAGLPPAMLTVIVTAVVSMVFGVMLIELEVAAGHGPVKTFLRAAFNVARNPLPMSIALGIFVSAIGLPIPTPVEKWLDLLGAAAGPCALFAIGLFLSDKSIKSGLAEAGLATLIKLLLQPLLAILVLPFFVDLQLGGGKGGAADGRPADGGQRLRARQAVRHLGRAEYRCGAIVDRLLGGHGFGSAGLAARILTTTEAVMLQEFKKFALRGNVVDLAIGVIIGVAFGKIVDSLVNDIIMPVIGRLFGGLDFTNYFIGLTPAASQAATYEAARKAGATLGYGTFITVTVNFIIIAWVLFLVIKGINRVSKAEEAAPAAPPPPTKEQVLLTEIRDLLKARG